MSSFIVSGKSLSIVCATDGRGQSPALDFLRSLETDPARKRDHANLMHLMKLLADEGRINNGEKFKQVAGTEPALFEFKKHQVRIFGFYAKTGEFVLTSGCIKKKDKLDPAELRRAQEIRKEHLQRQAKRTP